MYIEKRRIGKSIKYYLVYSYREKAKVKKIRRYLGLNLLAERLEKEEKIAEQQIKEELEKLNTEIFNFSLSKIQIEKLNKYNQQIKIHHLKAEDWKKFTEQFAYNTNAIEGSTVQLKEVHAILNKKKPENYEEIETKGVVKAINFIKDTKEDLSLKLIKHIHKLCFENSKHFAGEFRKVEVIIKDGDGKIIHMGTPVPKLDYALKNLISWYKKNKIKFKPLILAAIIHNQFEHIHPFQDGNGRVGRLLLNFILFKYKYPPINILLKDRFEYYNSLQEYSQHQNLKPTITFLIKQYNQTLKQVTTKKEHN